MGVRTLEEFVTDTEGGDPNDVVSLRCFMRSSDLSGKRWLVRSDECADTPFDTCHSLGNITRRRFRFPGEPVIFMVASTAQK